MAQVVQDGGDATSDEEALPCWVIRSATEQRCNASFSDVTVTDRLSLVVFTVDQASWLVH
jgi:hypothetical protein